MKLREGNNFEGCLARLSEVIFDSGRTVGELRKIAAAIGLAYGMGAQDVLTLAITDAAIATQKGRDHWLAPYPAWARGPGADYEINR